MASIEDAQDALARMARANSRGTGCHLTAEMMEGLSLTFMAELWSQGRPSVCDDYRPDLKAGGEDRTKSMRPVKEPEN